MNPEELPDYSENVNLKFKVDPVNTKKIKDWMEKVSKGFIFESNPNTTLKQLNRRRLISYIETSICTVFNHNETFPYPDDLIQSIKKFLTNLRKQKAIKSYRIRNNYFKLDISIVIP